MQELKEKIDSGLIKKIKIDCCIDLAVIFVVKKTRRPRYYWKVDLYYQLMSSKSKFAKPKFVVEIFEKPEHALAHDTKKKIYLSKSRNAVVIEHWAYKKYNGKSKSSIKHKKQAVINGNKIQFAY